jgi:hypothetical protein
VSQKYEKSGGAWKYTTWESANQSINQSINQTLTFDAAVRAHCLSCLMKSRDILEFLHIGRCANGTLKRHHVGSDEGARKKED